jgi:hypothetical protein
VEFGPSRRYNSYFAVSITYLVDTEGSGTLIIRIVNDIAKTRRRMGALQKTILFSFMFLAMNPHAQWSTDFEIDSVCISDIKMSHNYGWACGCNSLNEPCVYQYSNATWTRDTTWKTWRYNDTNIQQNLNCLAIIDTSKCYMILNCCYGITPFTEWSILLTHENGTWRKIDSMQYRIRAMSFMDDSNGLAIANVMMDSSCYTFQVPLALHFQSGKFTGCDTLSRTYSKIYSVFAVSKSSAWITCENGTILHYDGTSWSPQFSGQTSALNSIDFYDSSFGFACGDYGRIVRWQNGSWQPQNADADLSGVSLSSVLCVSGTQAIAAGQDGIFLKYDTAWQSLFHGPVTGYCSVAKSDSMTYWAAGNRGQKGVITKVVGGGVPVIRQKTINAALKTNPCHTRMVTVSGRRVTTTAAHGGLHIIKSNKVLIK